ncbi:hypothetical protein SAMN04488096_1302 [Mesonia phycicola]|uniref:Uncharacterized protein n=1 Tax=Mesonia phycicola TaxID=579105 RepID=A0A1M6HYB7_9FLAO|nr:hypothetical protein [Mesonia phycicola]SHJ27113.1 hypothetical protein SAMN04488096_1302 [Mesonia phycicola]
MKIISILTLLIIFSSFSFQDYLKSEKYISADKLQYITIKNDSVFEYFSYKYYSPYTKKKEWEKDSIKRMCGTYGYWGNGQGTGKYIINNDSLELYFDFKYSQISIDRMQNKKKKVMYFFLPDLEKLE